VWARAILVSLFPLLLGCESPRERACRSLVLQAHDAEDARTAGALDSRLAERRARSAARWIRTNAVVDPELKADALSLAAALDRLADSRPRLVAPGEALGTTDSADLLARATRVVAYAADIDKVARLEVGVCADSIDGPIAGRDCVALKMGLDCNRWRSGDSTLAAEAVACAASLERTTLAAVPSEAHDLARMLRATAAWAARLLPARPVAETIAQAQVVPMAIADRDRADSEIRRLSASIEGRCGPK
jgi:hypothetical protein